MYECGRSRGGGDGGRGGEGREESCKGRVVNGIYSKDMEQHLKGMSVERNS